MSGFAANRTIATVTLVVRDYNEAARWYAEKLGFAVEQDFDLGHGKRWVVVALPGGQGMKLLLAQAANEEQRSLIGDQTGGRVFLFLETGDFDGDHRAMLERGVVFHEAPRHEPYGTVAVFEDLYGNLFDLIQPKR